MVAVVVAAGQSRRFSADKLFVQLGRRPVLDWSLCVLDRSPRISSIVVVLSESNLSRGERLIDRRGRQKVRATCRGGPRRQDSVRIGLEHASDAEWVLIHDAARPFLTDELIERCFASARDVGGAVAAVPVKDTIKLVDSARLVRSTPPRDGLWAAQTPQVFRCERLLEAYQRNDGRETTDDAQLYERAGWPVAVVMGAYDNLKITTGEDLAHARALARNLTSKIAQRVNDGVLV